MGERSLVSRPQSPAVGRDCAFYTGGEGKGGNESGSCPRFCAMSQSGEKRDVPGGFRPMIPDERCSVCAPRALPIETMFRCPGRFCCGRFRCCSGAAVRRGHKIRLRWSLRLRSRRRPRPRLVRLHRPRSKSRDRAVRRLRARTPLQPFARLRRSGRSWPFRVLRPPSLGRMRRPGNGAPFRVGRASRRRFLRAIPSLSCPTRRRQRFHRSNKGRDR
jgi:hypothetical protein